ncbi:MAG: STAS domain-containing protein [Pseudomonadota bacterium]|nr:STAS domain-containing protein [Pseudomonadota bacterium]
MSEAEETKAAEETMVNQRVGSAAQILHEKQKLQVTVGARLTAVEAHNLQETLRQEIADGIRELVFDMKETIALDSTGIGLLVAANNSMRNTQGNMRLTNVRDDIYKLLRNMRLVERLSASREDEQVSHG